MAAIVVGVTAGRSSQGAIKGISQGSWLTGEEVVTLLWKTSKSSSALLACTALPPFW